jgi:hypothetical protein
MAGIISAVCPRLNISAVRAMLGLWKTSFLVPVDAPMISSSTVGLLVVVALIFGSPKFRVIVAGALLLILVAGAVSILVGG